MALLWRTVVLSHGRGEAYSVHSFAPLCLSCIAINSCTGIAKVDERMSRHWYSTVHHGVGIGDLDVNIRRVYTLI